MCIIISVLIYSGSWSLLRDIQHVDHAIISYLNSLFSLRVLYLETHNTIRFPQSITTITGIVSVRFRNPLCSMLTQHHRSTGYNIHYRID